MGGKVGAWSRTLGSVSTVEPLPHDTPLIQRRKIENFIRTKYESKRWVMDGPMPDPSELDVSDDDVVGIFLLDPRNLN